MNDAASNDGTTNAKAADKAENGKPEKDKSKFDWITERSACTLPKVFATLRQQTEEDVKTRNGMRPNYAAYEFSLAEDIDKFTVFLKAKDVQRSVTFTLADHAISVKDDQDNPMFQVTLIFDDCGECKLHAGELEREFWQVRRMALEDLMFRGY
jgi:hypothetical protein